MIRQSFVFLEGVGNGKEALIRKQGIQDWDAFLKAEKLKGISDQKKQKHNHTIRRASKALSDGASSFFCMRLPAAEMWRIYGHFRDECVFLDIETSGVGSHAYITVLGLFDGFDTKTMIRGVNLDIEAARSVLKEYSMIVTFNGSAFDIPFIKKRYPDLLPRVPCWDLRHSCARVGLKGGLKHIEKQLGIRRQNEIIERMHGGDAITLWRMYRGSGDPHYLELLVQYNEEDVINLKKIADTVYARLMNGFQ